MSRIRPRPGRMVCGAAAVVVLTAVCLPGAPALAQLNQLQGALGGGGIGGVGGALPSVTQASPSNTAGVLQFCIRNNYVDSGPAASVKSALAGRLAGSGGSTRDSGFQAGDSGMLQTGGGQNYSLGGSGVKAQVTHKVCDLVLQHARSLL